MNSLKILQVIPDLDLAGAETMCENLSKELLKNNEVAVISFFNRKTAIAKRLEKLGIKIFYLGKKRGLDLSMIFKIKKIIDDYKPEIIHSHRYAFDYVFLASKLCKHKGFKMVHTVHNVAEKEVPSYRIHFRKLFVKKNDVTYVAISKRIQETISQVYGLDKKDIPIVLNGVDISKCIKINDYSLKNKIVHIGRFSEQKNHKYLIDIFERIYKVYPNFKLVLVGQGELEDDVKNYVKTKKLENNVVFYGTVDSSYKVLNEADMFILPSKWEGIPMTIIEALGTGLPVIAANVGGIPDMIENNKDGFICESIDEYSDCINNLIKNQKLREKIGKNAIKKSFEFSSSMMCEQYLSIYNGEI